MLKIEYSDEKQYLDVSGRYADIVAELVMAVEDVLKGLKNSAPELEDTTRRFLIGKICGDGDRVDFNSMVSEQREAKQEVMQG